MTKRRATPSRKWIPLARGNLVPMPPDKVEAHVQAAIALGFNEEAARRGVADALKPPDAVWLNDRYVVHVDLSPPPPCAEGMIHLSIRRTDRKPVRDWRDLQRIKNEIAGPEREAIELFPAESRLVDSANQFHLWVLPDGMSVPVGWVDRFVSGDAGDTGAVQRPFEA